MLERLEHQVEALGVGQAAGLEVFQNLAVVAGVDHDGDVFVVLGRRADHGRAADVDVLDSGRQVTARLGDGGFERVQVDRDQIDRLDPVFGHDGVIGTATAEDAAVDFRVQGLDPAVHHFSEAGVIGNFHRGNAIVLEQLEGAAGGQDLDAELLQLTGEFKDPGLVGDADQGAADRQAGSLVGHFRFHNAVESAKKATSSNGSRLFWFGCLLTTNRTASAFCARCRG
ncbi:hypothetical protein D3C78_1151350 [compost metagenome]